MLQFNRLPGDAVGAAGQGPHCEEQGWDITSLVKGTDSGVGQTWVQSWLRHGPAR